MKASTNNLGPWAGLLIVLTLAAYAPALRGGYVWDDDLHVTANPTLRTPDGLRRIWFELHAVPQYYPLVHTSFWVEYHLWGLNPLGYHAVNVCLHALSALLLWAALRRLGVPGSWFAAALFALHPLQVESVAWITERKNVLSTFFYLLSTLCFVRFFGLDGGSPAREQPRQGRRPWRLYAAGFALFVCALLSKTVACSLPAVLLLLLWWKRDRIEGRDVAPLVPMFVVGAALGLTTAWIEKHHVGAHGEAWALSWLERGLIAGRALWFYVSKLLWPRDLTFIYPRWEIDTSAFLQYLFPLAAAAVIAALWLLRRRLGKAPLVAVLFFAGTLVPALGFFDVFPMRYSFVADHFQYLACVGLIALGSASGALVLERLGPRKQWLGCVAGAAVLATLGALTWRQAGIYKDAETLWRDVLAKNPGAWMAHTNLGLISSQQGKVDEAMARYRESLRLKPDLVEPRLNLAELLIREGRLEEAIALDREAVRLKPGHAWARYNLGTALARQGRFEEALVHLTEAARIQPHFAEAEYNIATALLKLERLDEAAAHYLEVLEVRPDHANAHNNLAGILERQGRMKEAAVHRAQAMRFKGEGPRP